MCVSMNKIQMQREGKKSQAPAGIEIVIHINWLCISQTPCSDNWQWPPSSTSLHSSHWALISLYLPFNNIVKSTNRPNQTWKPKQYSSSKYVEVNFFVYFKLVCSGYDWIHFGWIAFFLLKSQRLCFLNGTSQKKYHFLGMEQAKNGVP